MRALVTGGNGFIGSHLVDALLAGSHQVVVCDKNDRLYDEFPQKADFIRGDINQRTIVRDAVKGIDIVFHLSWSNVHEASNQDPVGDIRANLIPTIYLVEECRRAGVGRVVFVSSGGTVYGNPQSFPTPENHPQNPLSAYGITKLAAEKYLQLYHVLHGLDYVVFRPSVPYGPRQNPQARQGAVAVFLYRVAKGLPIILWGDGSASRDFFYISDLVDALTSGATCELGDDRIFNIGGENSVSLVHLLGMVEQVVGRKAQVEFAASRKFDAARIWLDTRQAQQGLCWRSRVSMQDGLARTWQWMKETLLNSSVETGT